MAKFAIGVKLAEHYFAIPDLRDQ
jgi:hypothetical protein